MVWSSGEKSLPNIVIMAEELDCVGGVQKFIDGLGRGLAQRGYPVTLIGLHESGVKVPYDRTAFKRVEFLKPDAGPLRETMLSPVFTEAEKNSAKEESHRLSMIARGRLASYLESLDAPTIIIATQVGALRELYSCGLTWGDSSPIVLAQYHGSFAYAAQQHYFATILELFPRANRSIFLTSGDARRFADAGIGNSRVMPNFVSRPPDVNPHNIDREKTVVSLSRYAQEKSLDELVEAWSLVCSSFPEWRLKLHGSGPDRSRIAAKIDELDLGDSVFLGGSVPNSALVLERASIHAMTSHQEGFPMAIMEASAMKVPSVVFNAGPSTPELIDNGKSGYIVDSSSIVEFSDCLQRLMGDSDLRSVFGERSYELSKKFQERPILNAWEALFQDVLE